MAAGVSTTGVVDAGISDTPLTTSAGVLLETDAVAMGAISCTAFSFSVLPCSCSNKILDVPGVVQGADSIFFLRIFSVLEQRLRKSLSNASACGVCFSRTALCSFVGSLACLSARPVSLGTRRCVMPTTVPFALWIADAAIIVCFLALLAYRAQVTRYEDDQLFLSNESGQHMRAQHTAIVHKIDKIGPLVRILGGAVILLTLAIISIPVWSAAKTMMQ
jgi:hypothetical protein